MGITYSTSELGITYSKIELGITYSKSEMGITFSTSELGIKYVFTLIYNLLPNNFPYNKVGTPFIPDKRPKNAGLHVNSRSHLLLCYVYIFDGLRLTWTYCVHINGHDRTITVILAKHCIELPDDGSLVIRNMLEQF
jgi:hypothetical protein